VSAEIFAKDEGGSWLSVRDAEYPTQKGLLEVTCGDGYEAAGVALNPEEVRALVKALEGWLRCAESDPPPAD
jgi:hypothetical protein